ncbi:MULTISPECIES: hypothetical protein [Leptospira]|nr:MULTISPECIES: hypothetical protein [Leptospira]OMI16842.1 hypothetical protein BUQ74_13420 [Leptospira weilii serovar Heyan]ULH28522.1 hypothetical protein FH586_19790 [Leptospira weilii]UPY79818.1 hypothetical protein FH581_016610 [Leptospira weilii]
MMTNLCIQCNRKESMRQTDLCEECLIENFKPLILLSNEIRYLDSKDTSNATSEEPKTSG